MTGEGNEVTLLVAAAGTLTFTSSFLVEFAKLFGLSGGVGGVQFRGNFVACTKYWRKSEVQQCAHFRKYCAGRIGITGKTQYLYYIKALVIRLLQTNSSLLSFPPLLLPIIYLLTIHVSSVTAPWLSSSLFSMYSQCMCVLFMTVIFPIPNSMVKFSTQSLGYRSTMSREAPADPIVK